MTTDVDVVVQGDATTAGALLRELKPGLQPAQLRELLAPEALSSLVTDHSIIVDACVAVARTAGTCACACTTARRAQLQNP